MRLTNYFNYPFEKFIKNLTVNETIQLLKINNMELTNNELNQIISLLTIDDIYKLKKMYLTDIKILDFYYYISMLNVDLDYNKYFESIISHYNKIYKSI